MWNLMPILRLLHHSWRDIGFQYDGLTPSEQECISREDHGALIDLMRAHGLLPSTGA